MVIKREVVGRLKDVDENTFKPISIFVVGYTELGDEEVTEIRFRARPPFKFIRDMIRSGAEVSVKDPTQALDYLDQCVVKADRLKWEGLQDSDEINVTWQTIVDVYLELIAIYGGKKRPLVPASSSRGGGSSTRPTSTGAPKSRASTAKKSPRKSG